MTKYAQSILDIASSVNRHLTAEQIYMRLKKRYPSVVIATVYNNLGTLTADGHLRRISMEGYPDRYDNTTRHDHLVCQSCGQLTDIQLSDMTARLSRQAGCSISHYDLRLYHTCDKCAQVDS